MEANGRQVVDNPTGLNSREQRDVLIGKYLCYVEAVAGYLLKKYRLPTDCRDELISAGAVGLVEAADRYDPSIKASFKSFAFLRIRGEMIDYIRKTCYLPRPQYRKISALKHATEIQSEIYEDEYRQSKLAEVNPEYAKSRSKSNTPVSRMANLLEFASKAAMAYKVDADQAEIEMSLARQAPASSPEDIVANKSEAELMTYFINQLPELQRYVIIEHYINDRSFSEICEINQEISRSWASKLHHKALGNIHNLYKIAKLNPEVLLSDLKLARKNNQSVRKVARRKTLDIYVKGRT